MKIAKKQLQTGFYYYYFYLLLYVGTRKYKRVIKLEKQRLENIKTEIFLWLFYIHVSQRNCSLNGFSTLHF